jgi:hypothetical protein
MDKLESGIPFTPDCVYLAQDNTISLTDEENSLRSMNWEWIVHFVNIGEIVDHHCTVLY